MVQVDAAKRWKLKTITQRNVSRQEVDEDYLTALEATWDEMMNAANNGWDDDEEELTRILATSVLELIPAIRRLRASGYKCPGCGSPISCPCGIGIGT